MKKLITIVLAAMLAAATASVPVFAAETQTYILRDNFGAAPLARSFSQDMEITELNAELNAYSEYGFAAHLKSSATGREYIEYDVDGVTEAEVSVLAAESVFGANHGWGVSLGVAEKTTDNPVNNTGNINLNMISPIYLSEDGKPFLFYENNWWGYIAEPKYSFIPAPGSIDVANQLRQFTVPDEVQGVVAEDGFTILEAGYLYPMINLEYRTQADGEWIPMSLDSSCYAITDAEFVGADKMYNVTVEITDIPADAISIRIGANYIRQTLKPSSETDKEPDVYTAFPRKVDESLFVTGVKLTLDTEYTGGFEELEQTGIEVDAADAMRYYAIGEEFSADGLKFLDVYNGGIKEENADTEQFTIDSSAFDAYAPNTYSIKVKKGDFEDSYNVRVEKPSELILDTSALDLSLEAGETFSVEGLTVKAKTNVPLRGEVETTVPEGKYSVNTESVDTSKAGTYEVTVTVGTGTNAVSASFDVTVIGETGSGNTDDNTNDTDNTGNTDETSGGCGGAVSAVWLAGGAALVGIFAVIAVKKRKNS